MYLAINDKLIAMSYGGCPEHRQTAEVKPRKSLKKGPSYETQ